MPIVLLIIAAALIVTAYKNTYGDLTSALQTDVPGFSKWGVSLLIVGSLGYVPGMQTVSRWLLALVLVVLVLRTYANNQSIFAGFANAFASASSGASTSQTDPATKIAQNPSNPSITTASIEGTTSSSASNVNAVQTAANVVSTYDPNTYLTSWLQSSGFGGA